MTAPNGSRRNFVKRGLYVAPAILTLAAAPEFAKAGSAKPTKNGPGRHDRDDRDDDRRGWSRRDDRHDNRRGGRDRDD
jgi:hypothetical protein